MRDLHAVRTPENVRFEFELAGLASRGLAWSIDLGVMVVLLSLLSVLAAALGWVFAGFVQALYFVALFAIQWGYGAVLEWRWRGQTVGKRVMGIRVVSSQGMPISFGPAALRNLLRVVDIMPGIYLVGAVCALRDGRARRLGDMAADTIVVRTRYSERPIPVVATVSERYNTFASDAQLAHATQRITPIERDATLALMLRRDQLPLAARQELFGKLAQHLEQRLGVQRPRWLSHERFVISVTAVAMEERAEQLRAGPTPREEVG
ncbi:MAG: hypothetical protein RL701_7942 [Pseudomonadota bacterium]|jgi:uncharacterized RDD family membrane protein YckC